MLTPIRLLLVGSILALCTLNLALGQEARKDPSNKTPIVTASVTSDGVRIAAPGAVVQLRLQVYDNTGQKLLDTEEGGGNVLDWHLQGSTGERVADGTYLCVVTIKSPSGRLSQKLGLATVSAQSTTLRSAGIAELNPLQAQLVGAIDGEDEGLAVVPAENIPPVTVLAQKGDEAQLTRTRGALSLRVGDFFSGKDTEQMRLTEDGRLGIGTHNPQATLDVAGTIRAERILISKPNQSDVKKKTGVDTSEGAAADGAQPLASGSGNQDQIAKWADNSGTLGDSVLKEVNGNIGLGVANPGDLLDISGPPNAAGARSGIHVTTTGSNGNATVYFDNDRGNFNAYGGVLTGGSANAHTIFGLPRADKTFLFADGPFSQGLGVGTLVPQPLVFGTTNTERMRITGGGNVGIGTIQPSDKLEVAGNVRLSGANSSLIFPDGSSMTTASGGPISGTSIVNAVNAPATVGTISDTRLSGNVARLSSANTFGASQTVNGTVTATGRVESNSGGFKFPDGSVQTSAAGKTYTTFPFGSEIEIGKPIADGGGAVSILQLDLPAGSYMVTATVQFENRGLFNKRMVAFQMINEATWFFRIEGSGGAMDQMPITMHTVINHSGGVVQVYCEAIDGSGRSNIFAKARRLTAIRLGDVVTQP